jgi:hypothetical protein
MRILLLIALLTGSVFAQNRSATPARGHSGPPPSMRPVGPPPVARPPIAARPMYPRTGAVPYPVFIGGGYYEPLVSGSDYGYGYAPPVPVAVVNQDFQTDSGTPSLIDYSNVSLPEAAPDADATSQLKDDQPTIFLIALTDHSVVAAIAYWVDGDTLNWVSRDAKQNRMSLSLVDRDFSKQLNDERHVDFKLPPAK